MKKVLIILGLCLFTSLTLFAQDEENDNANEKIRNKMSEFIQRRMNLNKAESERFIPIFFRYFREWRTTLKENRADKQLLQLRVAELRIKYRPEFKEIVGERRCNQIYDHQDMFIRELIDIRKDQLQRRPGLKRNRMMID
jgi:hypothetical protein